MRARKSPPHVQIPVLLIEEPCLLAVQDVARLLSVAPSTMHWWRCRRHLAGPSFVKVEGRVRYSLEAVRDFIASRTVRPPARIPKSFLERKKWIHAVLEEISRHPREERQGK
jgi:hypothetical protein